jgi:SAM-dependent methyltransferase
MTNQNNVFDEYADEYDAWFDAHPWVYQSEMRAVEMVFPQSGRGIEIGTGTGRFSAPFGISIGIEPSETMAAFAKRRGITVFKASAEHLPFADNAFDFALMVTTICFLEDPLQALREARRILRPGGKIIIGMLDGDSPVGREYDAKKKNSKFYRHARFYSVGQVLELLRTVGFESIRLLQTIFNNPEAMTAIEPVREGCGEGLFVVVSADKSGQ